MTIQEMERNGRNKINGWVNFCPVCGSKVEELPNEDTMESIRVRCTNKDCLFGHDNTALTLHHPIHGIDSAPGDSWALSWIK